MSDDEFLSVLGSGKEDATYITMVREIIGQICTVPAAKIHPDTDTELLYQIGPWNLEPWDDVGVIMAIEERLSAQEKQAIEMGEVDQKCFPPFIKRWRFFWWGRPNWTGFGEYAAAVAQYMVSRSRKTAKPNNAAAQDGETRCAPLPACEPVVMEEKNDI